MKKKILPPELAEQLALKSGISRREAADFVRAFFETIELGLQKENYVKIKGFGTFKLVNVAGRESVNIHTGERIQIPGHVKVAFTPDALLRDLVNAPFAHFETTLLEEGTSTEELLTLDEHFETENTEATTSAEAELLAALESLMQQVNPQEEIGTATEEATTPETPSEETPQEQESTEETEITPQEVSQPSEPVETKSEKIKIFSEEIKTPSEEISDASEEEDEDLEEENYYERKTFSFWKILGIIIGILLLMAGSYWAGHHRVLSPYLPTIFGSDQQTTIAADSIQKKPQPAPIVQPNDSLTATTESTLLNKEDTAQKEAQLKVQKTQKGLSQGKIVGTLRDYTVRRGQTLHSISREIYGTGAYVPYIIQHNHLREANYIEIGDIIHLPKVEF